MTAGLRLLSTTAVLPVPVVATETTVPPAGQSGGPVRPQPGTAATPQPGVRDFTETGGREGDTTAAAGTGLSHLTGRTPGVNAVRGTEQVTSPVCSHHLSISLYFRTQDLHTWGPSEQRL